MENEEKIAKLEELKILLDKAWEITNILIGEEPTHSRNQNILYEIRQDLGFHENCLKRIKFE